MPIEHKREGNTCERCKKLDTEVGKITHYTKDGADLLLCPKCLEQREKSYTEKCPKCKKIAYQHGGMSVYGESPENFENMCLECVQKKEARAVRNLRIKNFIIKHWKFWITITVGIIGLIITISRL